MRGPDGATVSNQEGWLIMLTRMPETWFQYYPNIVMNRNESKVSVL